MAVSDRFCHEYHSNADYLCDAVIVTDNAYTTGVV